MIKDYTDTLLLYNNAYKLANKKFFGTLKEIYCSPIRCKKMILLKEGMY